MPNSEFWITRLKPDAQKQQQNKINQQVPKSSTPGSEGEDVQTQKDQATNYIQWHIVHEKYTTCNISISVVNAQLEMSKGCWSAAELGNACLSTHRQKCQRKSLLHSLGQIITIWEMIDIYLSSLCTHTSAAFQMKSLKLTSKRNDKTTC